MIAFVLTMPGCGSWNGRWSGDGETYAILRSSPRSIKARKRYEPLLGKRHYYNFGDGWTACVEVMEVDAKEARRLRSASKGFYGYNWMVESLLAVGHITPKWSKGEDR